MMGITLAGAAIQNSLPGGTVFSFAYTFRQYRRNGADDVLAGWTLVAFNAVAFVCLAALATVGLTMALSTGNTFDLVESILGILVGAMVVVVAWTERARILPHLARAVRTVSAPVPPAAIRKSRPTKSMSQSDRRDQRRGPGRGNWARAAVMGMSNWVADMGCLTLSFIAVGAGVPWRGLILAYGAGQLATALPITPGGLGVVEGSLTVALVTFGGGEASTVAAVLLYRLISFWLLLPVGWGAWIALALKGREPQIATPAAAA